MRFSLLVIGVVLALSGAAMAAGNDGWRVIRSSQAMQTGVGPAPDAQGRQAFYVTFPPQQGRRHRTAYFEKAIPAGPWRGQRLRLSLLIKDEGGMHPFVNVAVRDMDTNAIVSRTQGNPQGGNAWTVYQYVVDVPDNADAILARVSFTRDARAGTSWIDGPILKAVSKDVKLTAFHRYIATAPSGCVSLGCPN